MQKHIVIVLMLIVANAILAQPLREIPVGRKIVAAEEAIGNGNYYKALELYDEVYKEKEILR